MPPKKRGPTYSTEEVEYLLELVEEIVPISQMDWEQLAVRHNEVWTTQREYEGLRRKYKSLAESRMPTGDPNCPPLTMKAKATQQEIIKKAELNLHDSDSEEESQVAEGVAVQPEDVPIPGIHQDTTSLASSTSARANATTVVTPTASSSPRTKVSPKLTRVSKKKPEENFSVNDFIKYSVMMREEDRIAREEERRQREEERRMRENEMREERLERDREDRRFQSILVTALLRGNDFNLKDLNAGSSNNNA